MRLLILIGACCLLMRASEPQGCPESDNAPVRIEMKNVNFRFGRELRFQVYTLAGRMMRTQRGRPVTFDDQNSFRIDADSGDVSITTQDLTRLLNTYVFGYDGSPLKNLTASAEGERLRLKGTLKKGVSLPFDVEGSLAPTRDGNIRFHAEQIHSAHIPIKGLMHLIGENLSKIVKIHEDRGVVMEGDDIIMRPEQMLPAPHIRGRVSAVRISGHAIRLVFGSTGAKWIDPPVAAKNYIYHQGGVIRFGKLTMDPSDLEIIDETPETPFDFFLGDYKRQLAAGYSKNIRSDGLAVFMPDYDRLPKR